MNQMFVIDIYLNKFKNHFCSINPRFFRYFACGLNGYVGMIDFNSHQWIKYGFVAFAVAIALASLLFSNKLVRELTIEERNKIEIWILKCEPDEKYTYQGANLLVDGLQGDDNYRSGRYIGLYGQNFDAIIDLQETKEISSVSLGTYLVPGDYIFGLTGLEIYGSNDGSAYSKIASKTIPVLEKGSKNNVLKRDTVSFGKTKARYVRIIGKNTPVLPKWHPGAGKRTYLFLDEITID